MSTRIPALAVLGASVALAALTAPAEAANYRDTVAFTPGLVSHWRLGEASGTTAADAKGLQSATYNGAVDRGQAGALLGDANTAVNFNAQSEFLSIPDRSQYDLNGFTVELWVNLNAYGDTSGWRRIASKGASPAERNWLLSLAAGTNGRVVYSYSDGTSFKQGTSNVDLQLNRWYHLAYTHVPGTKIQLFVDGVLDSEVATTTTPVTGTTTGNVAGDGAEWTSARYDEVAIYNQALSAERIKQHHGAGRSSDTTAPDTTITAGPSGTTTSSSASFSFTASETGSTFECSLDSGAYGSCTSPKAHSGLALGSHTFRVRARDAAGNVDASPATRTWTIEAPCPSWTTFTVGAPACWRPYAPTSPWNKLLPGSPQLHPRSSQIVSRMLSWGAAQQVLAGHSGTGMDYNHPVYFAKSTDPLFTLQATASWCDTSKVSGQIRIPDAARPAGGGDAHLAVVQPDGTEYDLWAVQSKPAGGGTLTFGCGGTTNIDGTGLGTNATAAHFGLAAGIMRGPEMQAGKINHALFMGVRCTDDYAAAVYPAAANTGEPCSVHHGEANADAPPMGARFFLDMTYAEIDALAVPAWKKTILKAIRDYGMYVGDGIGSGSWNLQFESGSSYTSFGQTDPMVTFAQSVGAPMWEGAYVFNLEDGVPWSTRLKVAAPCVAQGTC